MAGLADYTGGAAAYTGGAAAYTRGRIITKDKFWNFYRFTSNYFLFLPILFCKMMSFHWFGKIMLLKI